MEMHEILSLPDLLRAKIKFLKFKNLIASFIQNIKFLIMSKFWLSGLFRFALYFPKNK